MTDIWEQRQELVDALRALVKSCGHLLTCSFKSCNCGKTEQQRDALATANRVLRNLNDSRK